MYDHPNNVFVAGFIGSPAMNLLDGRVTDGGVKFGDATVPVERDAPRRRSATTSRSACAPRTSSSPTDGHGLAVTVDVVEELGADAYIYGSTKAAQHVDEDDERRTEKPFIARVDGRKPPAKGETVYLAPKAGHVHLFDAETGLRLGD